MDPLKAGCAKKQAKKLDLSFMQEDNRPCMKFYNEEDLPVKRHKAQDSEFPKTQNKPAPAQVKVQTVLPNNINKFFDYVDKLESIFKSAPLLAVEEKIDEPQLSLEDVLPDNSQLSQAEMLQKLVQELDKATKLTPSQVKVVQSFGIAYEVDPWKYEPRVVNNWSNGDRHFFKKPRKQRRYFNEPRKTARIQDVNVDEIFTELPEEVKRKLFPVKYCVKPLDVGFSLRKSIIQQGNM